MSDACKPGRHVMDFDKEMMLALEADGEYLRAVTGEEHGPFCPDCLGAGMRDSGGVYPWGEPILVPCDCSPTSANEGESHD